MALPLVPVLYTHDFLVLVALRPSLGILLLGAILARQGGMSLGAMLIIAVPLQLLIVWLYFLLGRAWQSAIHSDDTLPFLTRRLLRRDQVRRIREALRAHGSRLVVLARFAIFDRPAGRHRRGIWHEAGTVLPGRWADSIRGRRRTGRRRQAMAWAWRNENPTCG